MRMIIEDMECAAKHDKDGQSNVRINGIWLTVKWKRKRHRFVYCYGLNELTRKGAKIVLDGG